MYLTAILRNLNVGQKDGKKGKKPRVVLVGAETSRTKQDHIWNPFVTAIPSLSCSISKARDPRPTFGRLEALAGNSRVEMECDALNLRFITLREFPRVENVLRKLGFKWLPLCILLGARTPLAAQLALVPLDKHWNYPTFQGREGASEIRTASNLEPDAGAPRASDFKYRARWLENKNDRHTLSRGLPRSRYHPDEGTDSFWAVNKTECLARPSRKCERMHAISVHSFDDRTKIGLHETFPPRAAYVIDLIFDFWLWNG
ncbi:hypothetical protein DFH06DRAFT_1144147 [Mycena polygramma]|nr:hypothetical protein DFH06DRAFT_1144147 [Mycena polygramma]